MRRSYSKSSACKGDPEFDMGSVVFRILRTAVANDLKMSATFGTLFSFLSHFTDVLADTLSFALSCGTCLPPSLLKEWRSSRSSASWSGLAASTQLGLHRSPHSRWSLSWVSSRRPCEHLRKLVACKPEKHPHQTTSVAMRLISASCSAMCPTSSNSRWHGSIAAASAGGCRIFLR